MESVFFAVPTVPPDAQAWLTFYVGAWNGDLCHRRPTLRRIVAVQAWWMINDHEQPLECRYRGG